jgi:hypothetical protein
VQNVLSSRSISKNLEIRIFKIKNLPVVCMGVKFGFLTLREEHRLRVFEYRVLRRILELKIDEITEDLRKLHSVDIYNFVFRQV